MLAPVSGTDHVDLMVMAAVLHARALQAWATQLCTDGVALCMSLCWSQARPGSTLQAKRRLHVVCDHWIL